MEDLYQNQENTGTVFSNNQSGTYGPEKQTIFSNNGEQNIPLINNSQFTGINQENNGENFYNQLENNNIQNGESNSFIQYPENWNNYLDLKGKILSIAVKNKASDIYITSGFEVGIKIYGNIYPIKELGIINTDQIKQFLNSIFTEKQKNTFQESLELDFAYSWENLNNKKERFRVNAFHQSKKPSVALRYLLNEGNTFESLGLPKILKNLSERNSGIILICGITGSGKSATIAAMIDYINSNFAKHIISIEDPIEYTFKKKKSWIEQREVGTDTISFQKAMKSAFRQNPNVLFLGEMRDLESIAAAITIAESGHLVLSTIHARNSIQCINKIIDGFPSRQQNQIRIQLSEALFAILTQKLIPSKNKKGLELVMEIMINNSATSNLIRENQVHQIESIIQTSSQEGMKLLDNDILRLVQENKINTQDAIKYSNNPNGMKKILMESGLI